MKYQPKIVSTEALQHSGKVRVWFAFGGLKGDRVESVEWTLSETAQLIRDLSGHLGVCLRNRKLEPPSAA